MHDPARMDSQRKRDPCREPLVDTNLSADEHLAAASQLPHPFAQSVCLEKDLQFAVRAATALGLEAAAERDVAYLQVRKLIRATQPLDVHLLKQRPVHHVQGMCPAAFAAIISILKWPDREFTIQTNFRI